MATVVSDAPGLRPWASQEETSPFLLEHMVEVQRSRRQSQDETSPFPLVLGLFARRRARQQNETSPFLLVPLASGASEEREESEESEPELEAVPAARSARPAAPPRLQWRGMDASPELLQYAARVASGERLPPYSGPLLAGGAAPAAALEAALDATFAEQRKPPVGDNPTQGGGIKLLLGLVLMLGALVAAATAGDDAELRAAGQAVSRFLMGESASFEAAVPGAPVAPVAPAIPPATGVAAPCVAPPSPAAP